MSYDTGKIIITPKRVSDKTIDWAQKFDEALGSVRQTAKRRALPLRPSMRPLRRLGSGRTDEGGY